MAHFELSDIPYRSQWDSDAALSRGDCGIVCVTMLANWRGIEITPDELLRFAELPVQQATYTFAQLMKAGNAVGLRFTYQRPATWDNIRAALIAGQPSITLLKYGEISGNQDTFTGAHFWLNVGYTETEAITHDSNFWQPRRDEGKFRRVPLFEYQKAIGDSLTQTGNMPYQSLFLE